MGLYKHHKTVSEGKTKPLVPCADACGVITAVGEGSATIPWKVGDRVVSIFNQTHLKGQVKAHHMAHGLGLPLDGVLATHRVFPSYGLVKAPEYMTDEEASCLPIAAVTAWMAINGMRPMGQPGGAGEVVLLQGTGGVSISGLQIAKASGAKGKLGFLVCIICQASVVYRCVCCQRLNLHRRAVRAQFSTTPCALRVFPVFPALSACDLGEC